ncbi:MAG: Fe-S-cluster-containing hydrogenase [Deltaproteobacteria bacterium]|nr:Fe-S-cluster-containing hydrogenase [Deltaproteobacteria bacterium]
MSKRQPYNFADNAPDAPHYWTSVEDLEGQLTQSPEYEARVKAAVDQEFGPGDADGPTDDVSRRNFLGIMGASIGLATLEGCRRPEENILPYARMPAQVNPGIPNHYTTVFVDRGDALGLLVESHEGRPTKVEGNPDHPSTRMGATHGAASLRAQASVLDLYDPDRMRQPMMGTERKTWSEFDTALEEMLAPHRANGGEGLRFLTQPSVSPSFLRMREQIKQRFPQAKFHTYESSPLDNIRKGIELAFGTMGNVAYELATSKVTLSLDADFLATEPGNLRSTRGWAASRKMTGATDRDMSRLYVVESTTTVTGGAADHRLRLASRDVHAYLSALAAKLAQLGLALPGLSSALTESATPAGVPAHWIDAVAADLLRARGESAVIAGVRQPAAVHALAHAINHALGNVGHTVQIFPVTDALESESLASIVSLCNDIASVRTLIILGGNPAYDAPAALDFTSKLRGIANSLHATLHHDETSAASKWCVPVAHYLETWGDARALDGTLTIQQPLVEPLYASRSEIELFAQMLAAGPRAGYDIVRATFIDAHPWTVASETKWRRSLTTGVVPDSTATQVATATVRAAEIGAALQALRARPAQALSAQRFEVVFTVDAKLVDGRNANNAWLQELPDPITKISWDNAAMMSPKAARELSITSGDKIEITLDGRKLTVVAFVLPGQADYSIALALGWGRTMAGRVGTNQGFDVNVLRSADAFFMAEGATVRKTGERYALSQSQEYHRMVDRPLAVETTLAKYRETPNFPDYRTPTPRTLPLWRDVDYSHGYKWGLIVDLTSCTGCSACIVACQAENNIPCVGKDQVARGREMLWLRIDRYFVSPRVSAEGHPSDEDTVLVENEPLMAVQPVACVQCEEAPCENVCPVNATVHSPEGLNDMAYNRCIGTRYCSNNCPYKVRRFNYLNFHNDSVYQPLDPDVPETVRMQHNPNVTVRFRGVMEKCTYCVQRIQEGKIKAKNEYRKVRDGEIQTACQQTCPAGAITFGDLNDPQAAVAHLVRTDRRYRLLAELGTKPRTTYLAKIRNPNSEMHG